MFRRLSTSLFAAVLFGGVATPVLAQTTTYRLHTEASTTAGLKQLKTAAPDAAAVAIQTANLQSTAAGEKVIAQFNTATGVPGVAGKIPIGATIAATVWMKKTASLGAMVPRLKVRLDNASGTLLCTATGTTALTTTLAAYPLSCTTTAVITLTATSRLYVWAGVNLTTTASSGAFRGELDIEGTAGGNYDSTVAIPNALPAPTITSLTPSSGGVGTSVTIAGTNFRDQQLGGTVKFFNNKTATITSWTNTAIVAAVPTGTTTGAVSVTVAGTASNTSTFTIVPPPSITSLSPASGPVGANVTITGANFGATQGTSTVKFNGTTAAVSTWAPTQISAVVPSSATTGNVVVTVNGASSAGAAFTVVAPPAVPVLSPGSGTYAAGQLVTVTSATSGTAIYYTVDGQDPTTADYPLANGGTVPVGNYTLKARSYLAGSASAVAQAVYQRSSSACTYVVRPGALSLGGAISAGQLAVTPSSEFCDWTATSSEPWLTLGSASGTGTKTFSVLVAANSSGAVRNASITIGSTVVPVVQNVVSTCTFGVAPSAVAAGSAAGGGSLSVATSDPACAWVAATDVPWVTLGAASGVGGGSVSYTYTANPGPAARWSGLTVGDQQVSVTQASTTALTVAGGTTPAANALGWHRQDATVVFTCAGPGNITCATPVSVTTDGIHEITGQATNDLSQTASTTVTVRIDRVAPHVAVSFPRANSLVQPGPVTISGAVTDALSDPVVVCNGALATVSGGAFACTLNVASGTTTVPIAAVDAAGNARSITATISTTDAIVNPPTNLRVSPQDVTIAVGQRWHFAMLDDLDRAPVDVAWARTNPALSTLTVTDGVAELIAVATGTTTLTASWRGLTANTTVTIVSANAFVAGTTVWNAPPLATGATIVDVLTGATTPAGERFLYAVERGATDRVRVFSPEGAERSSIDTGGFVTQLSGDALGGVVAAVEGGPLVRVGADGGATPLPTCAGGGFAIHPDGALYCMSYAPSGALRLSSIDIGLGSGRIVDLPLQPDGNPGGPGAPTVMPDGSVALPYVQDIGTGAFEPRHVVRLLLSRPDGSTSTHSLMNETPPQYLGGFSAYKAIPDGQGGYFVAYDQSGPSVNYYGAMLAHLDSSGVVQNVAQVAGGQPGVGAATWYGWSGAGTSHGRLAMGPSGFGGDILVATLNMWQNGQPGVGAVDLSANGFPISSSWWQSNSQWTYLSDARGFVVSLPNGIIGGPGDGWDLMTLTNPRPSRGGAWLGSTVNGLTEMVGPAFVRAVSNWGYGGGDVAQANASQRPNYTHLQPILSLGVSSATGNPVAERWLRSKVDSYQVRGTHDYLVGPRATPWQFLAEVTDPKNDAVSFLGHAVQNPSGFGAPGAGGAPGLYFFDEFALTKVGYYGRRADLSTFPPTPNYTHQVETVPTSIKVLFLGTCDVGSILQSMFLLNGQQAVIHAVFPGPNNRAKLVELGGAAEAWVIVMGELGKPGKTVADAVVKGNEYLTGRYPQSSDLYFQLAIYGNPSTRLVP